MASKGVTAVVLTVSAAIAVSACSTGESPQRSPSPEPTAETRSPGESVLGVSTPESGEVPECEEPVVHRKPNVPTAELTVHGVPGDFFSYEVIKNDGSITTGHTEFGPGQRRAVFTTGVPNAEISNIQISARGHVGTPGRCVISTIE